MYGTLAEFLRIIAVHMERARGERLDENYRD